jgi:hypothetical protein
MIIIFLALLVVLSASSAAWSVRPAEPGDLGAIVDVVLAAMPGDPSWGYRYPNISDYYKDHYQFHHKLFEYLISPKHDDWQVIVAEHPNDDKPDESIVAAIALWNVSYINLRKHGSSYTPQNRRSLAPVALVTMINHQRITLIMACSGPIH